MPLKKQLTNLVLFINFTEPNGKLEVHAQQRYSSDETVSYSAANIPVCTASIAQKKCFVQHSTNSDKKQG